MNFFISIFRSALVDFGKNKGRTFLTSLGIMIGVLSVVLLMAAGSGLKLFIKNQFFKLRFFLFINQRFIHHHSQAQRYGKERIAAELEKIIKTFKRYCYLFAAVKILSGDFSAILCDEQRLAIIKF